MSTPSRQRAAEQVLKYLARYTHRVAISNRRIESLSADGQVTFTYKDYAHGGRVQRMELPADEFLRRFSQHVLPRGFVRLRGFGLLANCVESGTWPAAERRWESLGARPVPRTPPANCRRNGKTAPPKRRKGSRAAGTAGKPRCGRWPGCRVRPYPS